MKPTEHMVALANRLSEFEPGQSAQDIVDNWINELVTKAQHDSDPILPLPPRRSEPKAVRFVLADGGSIADITFVFTEADVVDYAVLDYSETQARAQRVLTGQDANLLFAGLERQAKTP